MFSTMLELLSEIVFSQSPLSYLCFGIILKFLIETLAFAISFSSRCLINYVGTSNVIFISTFLSIKSTQSIGLVLLSLSKKVQYVTNKTPWRMLPVMLLLIFRLIMAHASSFFAYS